MIEGARTTEEDKSEDSEENPVFFVSLGLAALHALYNLSLGSHRWNDQLPMNDGDVRRGWELVQKLWQEIDTFGRCQGEKNWLLIKFFV